MGQLKTIFISLCIVAYFNVQADKYTDENRPYEFGFTIDGEQHRHEKKDENGIIMGEFGFITADGVYHVTVYATDENGNFKIISMKNIRVKPYPTAPKSTSVRQGHALQLPSLLQTPKLQSNNGAQQIKQKQNLESAKTCSHCSVPTTTTPSPKLFSEESLNQNNQPKENEYYTRTQSNRNSSSHEQNSQEKLSQNDYTQNLYTSRDQKQFTRTGENQANDAATGQQYSQNKFKKQPSQSIDLPRTPSYPQNPGAGQNYQLESNLKNNYPQISSVGQTYPTSPGTGQADLQNYPQTFESYPNGGQKYSQGSPSLGSNTDQLHPQTQGQKGITAGQIYAKSNVPQNKVNNGNRHPKSFNDILESVNPEQEYNSVRLLQPGQSNPKKPVLVAAQMQIVDKNTDIYHKNPGEKDGLPEGLTNNDMKELLYTFNYTVGFHGHHEKGYSNGAKYGYYYVTGRNGVRTRVDYVADESGFHPKISQEVLDVLSDDVPKPETERDEKYGLKGYEFKWLYYPVK